jgi:hypothetical protein
MKRGISAYRHRNVVRQRLALGALGFGDGVADLPKGLGLAFAGRQHCVRDDALLERGAKKRLKFFVYARFRIRGRCFDQGMPATLAGKRRPRAWHMLEHELERVFRHQLEAFDAVGAGFKEPQ